MPSKDQSGSPFHVLRRLIFGWSDIGRAYQIRPSISLAWCVALILVGIGWNVGREAYLDHQKNRYATAATVVHSASPTPTVQSSMAPSQTPSASSSATASPSVTPQPAAVAIVPVHIVIPAGPAWDQLDTIVYPKPSTDTKWGVPAQGDLDVVPGRPSYGKPIDPMMAVTWWNNGPNPIGPALRPGDLPPVMLGHTELNDTTGSFKDLPKLTPGAAVILTAADGSQLHLQVLKVVPGLSKAGNAFGAELANVPEGAVGVLGTCSGAVQGYSHEDNTLVWLGQMPQPQTSG